MMNSDDIDNDIPLCKKRRSCKVLLKCSEEQPGGTVKNVGGNNSPKKHIPRFRLKAIGEKASLDTPSSERVPIMLTDVQHLLLHSLFGNLNLTQPPGWYAFDKGQHISQTTCLILDGVSLQHWEKHTKVFQSTKKIFDSCVEVLTPSVYAGSLVQELALVPLSETEKEVLIQKYGSMNLALQVRKDLNIMMKAVFPIQDDYINNVETNNGLDKFPRTQLILSACQLVEENYPIPLKGKLKNAFCDYVMSKDVYMPVTKNSPMFGLDCEMCMTNAGSELTRVSVVNEQHEIVYETFVKPYNDITDYLTRYSGVTEKILNNVTKRLEDVQRDVKALLPPDAILIGQSLNIDLHALKMMHPYVIDTSMIYNFAGVRTRKPKLKVLAKEFLNIDIQAGKNGHCSIEDAITSMKLVQLKLSKSIEYGDAVHTNRRQFKENLNKSSNCTKYALSIFNHMLEQKKSSVVIGCDNITGDYHTYITQAKEALSTQLKNGKKKKVRLLTVDGAEEVILNLQETVNNHNFVMAHLKLDFNDENELNQMKVIDKWIETVWQSIEVSALCTVILGGTSNDNGVAMIKIKT